MSLTTPDVEAMLEGNEEVVQLQLRAGNISSGRPAGQCAKEQKKRDASEQSTEEAPSSEEVGEGGRRRREEEGGRRRGIIGPPKLL